MSLITLLRTAITSAGGTPAAYDEIRLLRELVAAYGGTPTKWTVSGLLREAITAAGGTPTQWGTIGLMRELVTATGGTPTTYSQRSLLEELSTGGPPPLFIFIGESNAEGYAFNTSATAEELQPSPRLQILDNVNLDGFEPLQIGVNNHNGHAGYTGRHGVDLHLATLVEQNRFGSGTAYMVQAAYGGTTFANWSDPGTRWSEFTARLAKARQLQPSAVPYVFYSLGLNDINGGMLPDDWKAAHIAFLARIRALLPTAPIIMTKFKTAEYGGNGGFNAKIGEIAASQSNIYFLQSTPDNWEADNQHRTYAGYKIWAEQFANVVTGAAETLPVVPTLGTNLITGNSSNFASGVGSWGAYSGATLQAVGGRLEVTPALYSAGAQLVWPVTSGVQYRLDVGVSGITLDEFRVAVFDGPLNAFFAGTPYHGTGGVRTVTFTPNTTSISILVQASTPGKLALNDVKLVAL